MARLQQEREEKCEEKCQEECEEKCEERNGDGCGGNGAAWHVCNKKLILLVAAMDGDRRAGIVCYIR